MCAVYINKASYLGLFIILSLLSYYVYLDILSEVRCMFISTYYLVKWEMFMIGTAVKQQILLSFKSRDKISLSNNKCQVHIVKFPVYNNNW